MNNFWFEEIQTFKEIYLYISIGEKNNRTIFIRSTVSIYFRVLYRIFE